MKYLSVNCSNLNWRISTNSFSQRKLLSNPNFSILSPYHHSKAYSDFGLLNNNRGTKLLNENECLLSTKGIIIKTKIDEPEYDELFEYLNAFLKCVRFESQQVNINTNVAVNSVTIHEKLPKGMLEMETVTKMGIRSSHYHTMITWDHIKNSDKSILNSVKPKAYQEIFLDAYKALLEDEYNKVILFSVISVESLLAYSYDLLYENQRVKTAKKSNQRWAYNATADTYHDPIFKALSDRTDFRRLLHEIPMYLLDKSILIDNEVLYQNLRKMYNTRNKIVHWGAPINHDPTKLIPLTKEGANLSFKCAHDCFLWLGMTEFEKIVNDGFIFIENGVQHGV